MRVGKVTVSQRIINQLVCGGKKVKLCIKLSLYSAKSERSRSAAPKEGCSYVEDGKK